MATGFTIGEALALEHPGQAPLAAILDNHVVSLRTPLEADATIRPVRAREAHGQRILRRTARHLLLSAALDVAPGQKLTAGQSMLGGTFFRLTPALHEASLAELCERLNAQIDALTARDLRLSTASSRWRRRRSC